jgi:hypothetical protein
MKTIAIALTLLVAFTAPGFAKHKKAQSDISSKYDQRNDGVAQNFR